MNDQSFLFAMLILRRNRARVQWIAGELTKKKSASKLRLPKSSEISPTMDGLEKALQDLKHAQKVVDQMKREGNRSNCVMIAPKQRPFD